MGKLPAILLYDGDWLKDNISGCSLAAQGLWLRMMFIGHNSERYGYLCQNGAAIPLESIARRCGCTPEQYVTLLAELDAANVPSRTPDGTLFSRRMVRDAQERESARKRKEKERARNKSHTPVTPYVTPLSVNEDVNEKKKERVLVFSNGDSVDFTPDVWVMKIKDAHPRLLRPLDTERVIVDALDMLQNRMGSVRNAAQYLLAKTELYKKKTDKWPPGPPTFEGERRFILGSFEWFKGHCYEEPETNWDRGEAVKPPVPVDNRRADEELNRQLGGMREKK